MSTKTLDQHIVITPGVVGSKPRIAGRRIAVQDIVIWHERLGQSPDEIAADYDLSLADIYAALAYYYDHQAEIDSTITKSEDFARSLRRKTPSKVAQKIRSQTEV